MNVTIRTVQKERKKKKMEKNIYKHITLKVAIGLIFLSGQNFIYIHMNIEDKDAQIDWIKNDNIYTSFIIFSRMQINRYIRQGEKSLHSYLFWLLIWFSSLNQSMYQVQWEIWKRWENLKFEHAFYLIKNSMCIH